MLVHCYKVIRSGFIIAGIIYIYRIRRKGNEESIKIQLLNMVQMCVGALLARVVILLGVGDIDEMGGRDVDAYDDYVVIIALVNGVRVDDFGVAGVLQ